MGRADNILGRFPAHFEALKPGKVLRSAVGALARDLDVQAAELAAIRRSHRLFDADVLSDLLLIAARHGIMASSLELVTMRFERARSLLKDSGGGRRRGGAGRGGCPAARALEPRGRGAEACAVCRSERRRLPGRSRGRGR